MYLEADEGLKAVLNKVTPAVLYLTIGDQHHKIRRIVYPMLQYGRIDIVDDIRIRMVNKLRCQWEGRKRVSIRSGRNNDDEWSKKESDRLIKKIACILKAHFGQHNVFGRIIWDFVETSFDAYFTANPKIHGKMAGNISHKPSLCRAYKAGWIGAVPPSPASSV